MQKEIFNNIEKEIILNRNFTIVSKINNDGIIEYVNDYFSHITGYSDIEILGQSNDIIRHEGMPIIIFKEIENRLHKTGKAYGIIKNLAKNGNYFWTIDKIDVKFDKSGKIESYFIKRKLISLSAKSEIEKLYKRLRAIELNNDVDVSKKYFYGFLENLEKDYYEYILSLLRLNEENIHDFFNIKGAGFKKNNTDNKELGIIERALLQN